MREIRLAVVLAPFVLFAACTRDKPEEPKAAPSETQVAPATAAAPEEIKIGQTMPYSGPASAYATIGRVEAAYFKKVNDEGGVNGRKLQLISLDDSYSPPKTVEQVRRLVEQDHVAFVFNSVGTAANSGTQRRTYAPSGSNRRP